MVHRGMLDSEPVKIGEKVFGADGHGVLRVVTES
jgi:hypothetical protein